MDGLEPVTSREEPQPKAQVLLLVEPTTKGLAVQVFFELQRDNWIYWDLKKEFYSTEC